MREIELEGGNASGVVVLSGGTVRKAATDSTFVVRRYLQYLQGQGLQVPRHFGLDERGRQKLEYIEGRLAIDGPALSHLELERVGRMVHKLHHASEGFVWNAGEQFESPITAPGKELMCHNDLAPWNLVVGERWVFIDWDAAAPSTRLWDLAYAAQSFALNDPSVQPELAAENLRAFLRGYQPEEQLRGALMPAMIERVGAMYELLRSSHQRGVEPWGSMFTRGHGAHWSAVGDYLTRHRAVLGAAA